ncbi:MAG TPA: HPF/RaiA family ribosome-associated protein [Thermoanaerobaculia bacterium]|nr:HPF/RaiA family ribosome-associated protein [Thermoanaerobaculia bacterium]
MTQTKRNRFPASRPRGKKRHAGATDVERTPLAIRAKGITISDETDSYIRQRLGRKLGGFADRIERLTVRFEDVNGPRGGVDIVCRAKAVLSGLPSVVVEERAETDHQAFGLVADGLTRAIRKALDRAPKPRRARGRRSVQSPVPPALDLPPDPGSVIGRRVGRGPANLAAALDRPEKRPGDNPIDTAAQETSASDRKAGYGSTARRNTRASTSGATATLEDSRQTRPSRKSTRKSANRAKSATNIQKKVVAATRSPGARAAKPRR